MSIYAVNGKEPVGAWIPSRDTVGNGTTTLHDLVGTNHGTLTNMDPATDWVIDDGKYALDFDGVNDFVNLPTTIMANLGSWALSLWVYSRQTTLRQSPFGDSLETFVSLPTIRFSSNKYQVLAGDGSQFFINTTDNSANGVTNGWEHLLLSYDSVALSVFRNGVLSHSFNAIGVLPPSGVKVRIGGGSSTSSISYNGRVDDVRIWNQPLDVTDVSYLYNNGNGRGIVTPLSLPRITGPDVVGSLGPVGRPRIVGPDVVGGLG